MSTFVQQLINGIAWGSVYSLIALGYTMVYGVLRMINFAHGDVVMVGAMFGLWLSKLMGAAAGPDFAGSITAFAVVLPVSMMFCAMVGIGIEQLAYRPLRRSPRIAVLITAIGVSFLLEYGGQAVLGATPRAFPRLVGGTTWTFFDSSLVISSIDLIIVTGSAPGSPLKPTLGSRTNISTETDEFFAAAEVGGTLDRGDSEWTQSDLLR